MNYNDPNSFNQYPPKKSNKKKIFGFIAVLLSVALIAGLASFAGVKLAGEFNSARDASLESNTAVSSSTQQSAATSGASSGSTASAADSSESNSKFTYTPAVSSGNKDQLSVAGVAAKSADAVVEITTETVSTSMYMGQYVSEGAGSGVIISSDGYIITNNHVIEGASTIVVTLRDGKQYDATLVGTDSQNDIAVVKVTPDETLTIAVIGNSDDLVVGEGAVAIGNPLGQLGGTVTDGIISALDREIEVDGQTMTLLQTNAAINPGNSGGGLFNMYGELIGIVNAKNSGSGVEGLGFAIPVNLAMETAQQLIDYGYVRGRVATGITLLDISDQVTAMMYRVSEPGVYVYQVDDQASGFRAGDRIVSVDGQQVDSSEAFDTIIKSHSIGDTVAVVVSRSSQETTVNLTLKEDVPTSSDSMKAN